MEFQCNRCKKILPSVDFRIKKNNCIAKTCQRCYERDILIKRDDHNYCKYCKKICTDEEFGFKANGIRYKCCANCRIKSKQNYYENRCEDNKQAYLCKFCNGASICNHGRRRYECVDCKGNGICEHSRRRWRCKLCGGGSVCHHNLIRYQCRKCLFISGKLINYTIRKWLKNCREHDKAKGLFNPDKFINRDFLLNLIQSYPRCYYPDCGIRLQYVIYDDDMATIERLNNNIGHTVENCVLACKNCNTTKKANKFKKRRNSV